MSKQPHSNGSRNKEEFFDKFEAWKDHEITKALFALLVNDAQSAQKRILDEALRIPSKNLPTDFQLIAQQSEGVRVIERISKIEAIDLLNASDEQGLD